MNETTLLNQEDQEQTMEFTFSRLKLFNVLKIMKDVIPPKSNSLGYNNFLFDLKGNLLKVTAINSNMEVSNTIEVQGKQDGSIVLDAKKFFDVLKYHINIDVNFLAKGEFLTLNSDTSYAFQYRNMFDTDYFMDSTMPELMADTDNTFDLRFDDFNQLQEKTIKFVSKDKLDTALPCLNLQIQDKRIIMIGTNGKQLGKVSIPTELSNIEGISIFPKAIMQVIKLGKLSKTTDLKICISNEMIQIVSDNFSITSDLYIEEKYPNIDNVIPKQPPKPIIVDKIDLIQALNIFSTNSNDKNHIVKMSFKDLNLTLSNRDEDTDIETKKVLKIDRVHVPKEVAYNAKYFIEILKLIDSKFVEIQINEHLHASIIRSKDEYHYFFLLMPIML